MRKGMGPRSGTAMSTAPLIVKLTCKRRISTPIHRAAREVFRGLGPGHREAVYQRALAVELRNAQNVVDEEVCIPIRYKDHTVGHCRADLVVYSPRTHNTHILECKVVSGGKGGKNHMPQIRKYVENYQSNGDVYGSLVLFPTQPEEEPEIVDCK